MSCLKPTRYQPPEKVRRACSVPNAMQTSTQYNSSAAATKGNITQRHKNSAGCVKLCSSRNFALVSHGQRFLNVTVLPQQTSKPEADSEAA